MGVFKLLSPKYEAHRVFYPVNRDWRRNLPLCIFQTLNLCWLLKLSFQHYTYKSPSRGMQLLPDEMLTTKPVEFI
jgi:hypothetical protein